MNRAQRRSNWLSSYRQSPQRNVGEFGAVRLRIGELVLHGFPPAARYSIAESARTELTSLLSAKGIPTEFKHNSERSSVNAGSFTLPATATPRAIGSLVARAIYGRAK